MVESPCDNQCALDEDDICVSCYRSLDEIINWSDLTDEQKKKVYENIIKRKERQD